MEYDMETDRELFHALDRQEAEDAAYEEQQERIIARAVELERALLTDIDACELAASELYGDPVDVLMQEAGRFFAKFEAAQTDSEMARAGYALWQALKPYMQAAVNDQAEYAARREIEAEDAGNRQDAADHAAAAWADR